MGIDWGGRKLNNITGPGEHPSTKINSLNKNTTAVISGTTGYVGLEITNVIINGITQQFCRIRLRPGMYLIRASAPAYRVGLHAVSIIAVR